MRIFMLVVLIIGMFGFGLGFLTASWEWDWFSENSEEVTTESQPTVNKDILAQIDVLVDQLRCVEAKVDAYPDLDEVNRIRRERFNLAPFTLSEYVHNLRSCP